MNKPERLAKRMANAGLCSRRDAEKWILAGRVSVNGKQIETPATLVSKEDKIVVDGQEIKNPTGQPRLFKLHKPVDYLCTARDPQGRPTVFELIPDNLPRLILVGRLDLNSEGLILLTTDGCLAEKLMHPNTQLNRTYRVRTFGELKSEYIQKLREGITLDDIRYRPMQIEEHSKGASGKNHRYTFTIQEGKNREIRHVIRGGDAHVNRLIRTEYGPFKLGTLEKGHIEEIAPTEVKKLIKSLTL